jgi:hypothetical protein
MGGGCNIAAEGGGAVGGKGTDADAEADEEAVIDAEAAAEEDGTTVL